MNISEKNDFLKLMASIAELYSKPLSPSMLEIYWAIFKDYPLVKIKKSIHLHLLHPDQGRFMPKPADLLKYLAITPEMIADNAWTQAIFYVRTKGISENIIFDDELIHAVISDLGGWRNFCHMQNAELIYTAKEFQKRYLYYYLHPPKIYPKILIGLYPDRPAIQAYKKSREDEIEKNNLNIAFIESKPNKDNNHHD
jgi:hypothetical protein